MRLAVFFAAACAAFAQKYTGPVPEKPDLLYIVQADNLIPAEAGTAQEQKGKKGETVYVVAGANSPARTPLAGPVFVLKSKDLPAEKLQLYKLEVKNGHREITVHAGKNAHNMEPIRVEIKHYDDGISRLEVSDHLANGQYCFSPEGANDVFCFEVF